MPARAQQLARHQDAPSIRQALELRRIEARIGEDRRGDRIAAPAPVARAVRAHEHQAVAVQDERLRGDAGIGFVGEPLGMMGARRQRKWLATTPITRPDESRTGAAMSPSAAVFEFCGPESITPSQGPLRALRNQALDATFRAHRRFARGALHGAVVIRGGDPVELRIGCGQLAEISLKLAGVIVAVAACTMRPAASIESRRRERLTELGLS